MFCTWGWIWGYYKSARLAVRKETRTWMRTVANWNLHGQIGTLRSSYNPYQSVLASNFAVNGYLQGKNSTLCPGFRVQLSPKESFPKLSSQNMLNKGEFSESYSHFCLVYLTNLHTVLCTEVWTSQSSLLSAWGMTSNTISSLQVNINLYLSKQYKKLRIAQLIFKVIWYIVE